MKIVYLREIIMDVFVTMLGLVGIITNIVGYTNWRNIVAIIILLIGVIVMLFFIVFNIKNYDHKLARRSKLTKKVIRKVTEHISNFQIKSWDKDKLQRDVNVMAVDKNCIIIRLTEKDSKLCYHLLNNIKISLGEDDNIEMDVNVDLKELDK